MPLTLSLQTVDTEQHAKRDEGDKYERIFSVSSGGRRLIVFKGSLISLVLENLIPHKIPI